MSPSDPTAEEVHAMSAPLRVSDWVTPSDDPVYRSFDGQPMSENTKQFEWIVTIKEGLETLYADRPDVFVAGDLLWYPVEGHPEIRVAPDALVVFGRPRGDRGSYIQFREGGVAPQVVFEVLSPGNRHEELERMFAFYDRYGVEEYYTYDPDDGEQCGWLRRDGRLEPVEDMEGWVSPRLGVRFERDGLKLRLIAPDGERFLSYPELRQDRDRIEQRRAEAEERHAEAERQRAEAERRRTEAERRRRQAERQRVEAERQQAEAERRRNDAERQRDDERANAERLREQLRALGIEPGA